MGIILQKKWYSNIILCFTIIVSLTYCSNKKSIQQANLDLQQSQDNAIVSSGKSSPLPVNTANLYQIISDESGFSLTIHDNYNVGAIAQQNIYRTQNNWQIWKILSCNNGYTYMIKNIQTGECLGSTVHGNPNVVSQYSCQCPEARLNWYIYNSGIINQSSNLPNTTFMLKNAANNLYLTTNNPQRQLNVPQDETNVCMKSADTNFYVASLNNQRYQVYNQQFFIQPVQSNGQPLVSVNINLANTSNKTNFSNKVFSTYSPELYGDQNAALSPANTLQPLNFSSLRYQIGLNSETVDTSKNGTYEFLFAGKASYVPKPQQTTSTFDYLELMQQSASHDLFLTIGPPDPGTSIYKIMPDINNDFDNWLIAAKPIYESLAAALSNYAGNQNFYIEIFGEPDLSVWNTTYGKNWSNIFLEYQMIYNAFLPYKKIHPNWKIGGAGFAYPNANNSFSTDFLNFCSNQNIKFDFISFHYYFGWTDTYVDNGDYGQYKSWCGGTCCWKNWDGSFIDFINMTKSYLNNPTYKNIFNSNTQMIVSEVSWMNANPPSFQSYQNSLATYRNCSKSLSMMDIILNQNMLYRAYIAQGPGQYNLNNAGSIWPFVSYNTDNGSYAYKAMYHALYFYGQMSGQSLEIDPLLTESRGINDITGVWASSDGQKLWIALWNKDIYNSQNINLSISGLIPQTSLPIQAKVYYINSETYALTGNGTALLAASDSNALIYTPNKQLPTPSSTITTLDAVLNDLKTNGLEPEASVFIEVTLPQR